MDRTPEFLRLLHDLGDLPYAPKVATTHVGNQMYLACSTVARSLEGMQTDIALLHKQVKKKNVFDDASVQSDALILEINKTNQSVGQNIEKLFGHIQVAHASGSAAQSMKAAVETLQLRHRNALLDFQRACDERNRSLVAQQQKRAKYYTAQRPAAEAISGQEMFDKPELFDRTLEREGLMGGPSGGLLRGPQLTFRDVGGEQERWKSIQNVQKAISDIATMFKKMSEVIALHDDMVERIDHNIDETTTNMESGRQDLMHYLNNISGNRKLILKVFGIILGFILFFIVFLS